MDRALPVGGRIISVQCELRPWFAHWATSLVKWNIGFSLSDEVEDDLNAHPTAITVLPAFNDKQVERVGAVAERFPLAQVVAVVNEVEGFRTREALQAGAALVINAHIPIEQYREVLQLTARRSEQTPAPIAFRETLSDDRVDIGPLSGMRHLGSADRELFGLLCSSRRTIDIAAELFCSERSVYRRIRSLYELCGVRNRAELRGLAARLGMSYPLR